MSKMEYYRQRSQHYNELVSDSYRRTQRKRKTLGWHSSVGRAVDL